MTKWRNVIHIKQEWYWTRLAACPLTIDRCRDRVTQSQNHLLLVIVEMTRYQDEKRQCTNNNEIGSNATTNAKSSRYTNCQIFQKGLISIDSDSISVARYVTQYQGRPYQQMMVPKALAYLKSLLHTVFLYFGTSLLILNSRNLSNKASSNVEIT